ESSLHVVPRFFNDGFREAEQVLAVMYRNVDSGGTATELKKLRLTLAGGESRHLRHEDQAVPIPADVTSEERNLNDLSSGEKAPRKKAFVLGEGTTENPYVNQSQERGVAHGVVLTIDLASLSGQPGRTVKERYRLNNYA